MHRLLKRQLKKIGCSDVECTRAQIQRLLLLVDQTYSDGDDDRLLLENTLTISSREMQGLYQELERKSQKELAKSEERFHRLIENLKNHYFFYIHDTEGVFTDLSDSITNILGYTKEEFMRYYGDFLSDDPMNAKVHEYTQRALSNERQSPYELSIYHKDGSVRYLEITELPLLSATGEVEALEGIARDITKQYAAQEKIFHLAKHDDLTGISNRFYLDEQLQTLLSSAKRHEKSFAMLFLDLDHFKQINDTLGHDVGDRLLQQVVARISPNIREEDIFARIGGDEFIIVLTNVDEAYLAVTIGKIMELMRQVWIMDDYELKVSTSMGIALYPQDGKTMVELMKNADIAMYRAKELGRDNFSFFTDELNQIVHEEMRLEQDMAQALRTHQFKLFYQPKMELATDRIIGAEALIKWDHPQMGMILPDKFIALAENTGFILRLGAWIIEEGCRAIARINRTTNTHVHLSINISTRQFQHGDLFKTIKDALDENGIDPKQFTIEITESVMMENSDEMIRRLEKIRELGVHICLDDFGTGYSSLAYLHRLPIDAIKIDKSFVDAIPKDGRKAILLDTIVAMGRTLGIAVIAEGVEEEYQRDYLIKQGCLFYQGYLFSHSVREEEYIEYLDAKAL